MTSLEERLQHITKKLVLLQTAQELYKMLKTKPIEDIKAISDVKTKDLAQQLYDMDQANGVKDLSGNIDPQEYFEVAKAVIAQVLMEGRRGQ